MSKEYSMTTDKIVDAENIEQTSVISKNEVAHRYDNINMVQNVLLIWLDSNINKENDTNYRNMIKQLQRVVYITHTFTNTNQCIDFLKDIDNEKVFMIISDALCQNIVPLIHQLKQLDAIFIFSGNKTSYEQWTKQWFKIKGVFTNNLSICDALKQAVQQCEHNAISISFMATNNNMFNKHLDQLDCSFMYAQILKEVLLKTEFKEKHIKQFIDYCRNVFIDNENEIVKVNKFERQYHDQTPIWWYTYDCFLYSMLNRALRLMDIDIIIKMGFFINDLHHQIKQLHSEQFKEYDLRKTMTFYRGQRLSQSDFDQLNSAKDGLLSFNNFLSVSKDRAASLLFAESNLSNPDIVGILFVITIDPSKSITPFASIDGISYFSAENEILFSMHTVFRISNIQPMNGNTRLFQVNLTLPSNNDKDFCLLNNRIRDETEGAQGWYRLGELLRQMDQPEKVQEIYEILLDQTTDESEKEYIYDQLGIIKEDRKEYQEAITFYEKSIDIYKNTASPNHLNLAVSHNTIGTVYNNMGDYSQAIAHYEKALEIQQQSLPQNHPDLASTYTDVGGVYINIGDYAKGLSSYEKALEIQQQLLPPNHPDLAMSYYNIGTMYETMGEYSKAVSSYEKAIEIQQQSPPSNHHELILSYNNISNIYFNMGEYSKALLSYEKTLELQQQSLPSNHPDLIVTYNNIGLVCDNMDEYLKACLYYEKALEIQQKSLPSNHPDLVGSYNNIGGTYENMGEYSKALSYYEKVLEIQQQSLPANHPDLAASYNKIGGIYFNMSEYTKALSSHEKALEIQQQSFPSNNSDLAMSYNYIGLVYDSMDDYSKARSYYDKALEIQQQSLSPNHHDLAASNSIGIVYENMDEYSKAGSHYEHALNIEEQSLLSNHSEPQR